MIGDPEAVPQVSGMCSVKGICPEWQRSQYTPQLQAAPWEPGLDGSCFPGDLDKQDLLSNYPYAHPSQQQGSLSSRPLAQKQQTSL